MSYLQVVPMFPCQFAAGKCATVLALGPLSWPNCFYTVLLQFAWQRFQSQIA
jgi:hypothetical protein